MLFRNSFGMQNCCFNRNFDCGNRGCNNFDKYDDKCEKEKEEKCDCGCRHFEDKIKEKFDCLEKESNKCDCCNYGKRDDNCYDKKDNCDDKRDDRKEEKICIRCKDKCRFVVEVDCDKRDDKKDNCDDDKKDKCRDKNDNCEKPKSCCWCNCCRCFK